MGDSLGDLKMVGQIPYNEIIRIGFLGENIDESLKDYKKNFDIILLGDGTLEFANTLVREIIREK